MAKIKNAIESILTCTECNALGGLYFSKEEDYDFEFCECNPHGLTADEISKFSTENLTQSEGK